MSDPTHPAPLPPHRGRDAQLDILAKPVASHRLSSLTLPDGSVERPATRLFLATPRGAAPEGGFPVLYMLDGNAAFDFLPPALLESAPDLVVAGVGYDTEKQFSRAHRVFDYSPPTAPGAPPHPDPHHPGRMAGGAGDFLARLTGPVRETAERGLRVNPARRTLWGHSFGGLFSLHTALTRPGAFARYAAISPSVWWNEAQLRDLAGRACFDPARTTQLYLGLGDREKRTGSDGPPPDGPAPATMALADKLRPLPGLDLTVEIYPGAVHIATLPASLGAAFRMATET